MPRIMDQHKEESILQAARELFTRFGFRKTTVDDIARSAGVAKGTVYLYFRSKEHLLVRIGMKDMLASQAQLAEELNSSRDAAWSLRRVITNKAADMFRFFESLPDAASVVPFLEKEEISSGGGQAYFSTHIELLRQALQSGLEAGRFRIEDPERMVRHICFITKAFDPPHRETRGFEDIQVEIDLYVDLLLQALERT